MHKEVSGKRHKAGRESEDVKMLLQDERKIPDDERSNLNNFRKHHPRKNSRIHPYNNSSQPKTNFWEHSVPITVSIPSVGPLPVAPIPKAPSNDKPFPNRDNRSSTPPMEESDSEDEDLKKGMLSLRV